MKLALVPAPAGDGFWIDFQRPFCFGEAEMADVLNVIATVAIVAIAVGICAGMLFWPPRRPHAGHGKDDDRSSGASSRS